MPDITGTVVDLVEQVTDKPDITPDSKFDSIDNWTSLAALRLLTDIEDTFAVKLDLRAYFATANVNQLAMLITNALTTVS